MAACMIDDSWYVRPPGIRERRGAGGVVVRWETGRLMVALIRGDGLAGYLLPKGGVERGETTEQAARREIEEEAGLTDLLLVDDFGLRERLSFDRSRWQVTHYFLFVTSQMGSAPTDPHHEYFVQWFPLNEIPALFWPEIITKFGGSPRSKRAQVLANLIDWRDRLRAKGLTGKLIFDASFISARPDPGDFDTLQQ